MPHTLNNNYDRLGEGCQSNWKTKREPLEKRWTGATTHSQLSNTGQASANQKPSLLCNPQSPEIQWNSLFSPLSVTVTPITSASLGDPSV